MCVFFQDSIKVASAQEKAILVSCGGIRLDGMLNRDALIVRVKDHQH